MYSNAWGNSLSVSKDAQDASFSESIHNECGICTDVIVQSD